MGGKEKGVVVNCKHRITVKASEQVKRESTQIQKRKGEVKQRKE